MMKASSLHRSTFQIPRKARGREGLRSRGIAPLQWGLLLAIFAGLVLFYPSQHLEKCGNSLADRKEVWGQLPGAEIRSSSEEAEFPRKLRPHPDAGALSRTEAEFWTQPDGQGFKPCLEASSEYISASPQVIGERNRYLMVVVNGGLNQLRNQICDAVVIARILRAALVLPFFKVNIIWQDWSDIADVFDVQHLKYVLRDDVRVVASLPSHLLSKRYVEVKDIPYGATHSWFRSNLAAKIVVERIVLLRGLDSRLSENLPLDLQRLRCKVEFHGLQFARPIQSIALRLARRLYSKGPYLALHLRLEKDVWVRTGCLPGDPSLDAQIVEERRRNPNMLTSRTNMSFTQRRLKGMCPLTVPEVAKLLKALGAGNETRVYWAGGQPFGGLRVLEPLEKAFPNLHTKDTLALPGELEPFKGKANMLAAIDFLICLESDVFMPSHGGNMGHVLQGFRAYLGHRKHITPNKRDLLPLLLNANLSDAAIVKGVRQAQGEKNSGEPQLRTERRGRDVIAFPVPECMCNGAAGERQRQLAAQGNESDSKLEFKPRKPPRNRHRRRGRAGQAGKASTDARGNALTSRVPPSATVLQKRAPVGALGTLRVAEGMPARKLEKQAAEKVQLERESEEDEREERPGAVQAEALWVVKRKGEREKERQGEQERLLREASQEENVVNTLVLQEGGDEEEAYRLGKLGDEDPGEGDPQ